MKFRALEKLHLDSYDPKQQLGDLYSISETFIEFQETLLWGEGWVNVVS